MATGSPTMSPLICKRRARWSPLEIAFWVFAFASDLAVSGQHLILTEIAILALFALSLDLILGYAGIISLGHAAFFGFGAYCAGLLAKYGSSREPVLALRRLRRWPRPCSALSRASWCCAAPT